MFRLNKSELKKIFLRPAVYVMLFLLAGAIVLSAFMFGQKTREDPTTTFGGAGQTVAMAFTAFNSSSSPDSKTSLDAQLLQTKTALETFATQDSLQDRLLENLQAINYSLTVSNAEKNTFRYAFWQYGLLQSEANKQLVINATVALATLADNVHKICLEEIFATNIDFFITTTNLKSVKEYSENLFLFLPPDTVLATYDHVAITEFGNTLMANYLPNNAIGIVEGAAKIDFNPTKLQEILDAYYTPVAFVEGSQTLLTKLYADVKAYALENADLDTAKARADFNALATKYKIACQTANSLLQNSFELEKANGHTDIELRQYIGYENFNSYTVRESVAFHAYLMSHQLFDGNYLTNFNFNSPSGYSVSAFDFCVFAMQILFVVLTIFALYFAITIMAGDMQNGTIKMIATRPISRTGIVAGKTLASINFTLIFAIFALVASFATGFALFGFGSGASVIMVLNAQTAIAMSPIVMLILFFLSGLLNILFYIVVANLLAVLFRSPAVALIIGFVLFVLQLALSALCVSASWFMFTPFAYLDLFRFMGGAGAGGFLSFGAPFGLSFFVAVLVFAAMIVLFDLLSKAIFKTRDIT